MTKTTAITISGSFTIDALAGVKSFEHRKILDGDQVLIYFENGYGASVARHSYSYGGLEGFYELAVITKPESEGEEFTIDHDSVTGWLSTAEVINKLTEIQAFQPIRQNTDV
jgi:hypothetical protein